MVAGVVLAVGLACALLLNRSTARADELAQDAVGDHRNCALKFRLVPMPIPLEEAAQQFDSTYRLLLTVPPDNLSTTGGEVRVVERHSCAYGPRRFGHVIMEYRGRVVSLLMTANYETTGGYDSVDAILLVSDLDSAELAKLSRTVSVPLAGRLERNVDAGDLLQRAVQLFPLALPASPN